MQCREFEGRLQRILDLRRSPSDDVDLCAHALGCEPCQQMLAGALQMLEVFSLPLPSRDFADSTFSDRVLSELAEPKPTPRQARHAHRLGALTAAAAALLVTAFATGWLTGPRVPRSASPPLASPLADQKMPAAQQAAPTAKLSAANVETQAALAASLGSATDQMPLRIWWEQLQPSAVPVAPSVNRLTGQLRPLADSFTVALDALRNTLPGGRDPQTPGPRPQA